MTNNFQILLFARFMAGLFGTAYGVIATTTIASLSSNKNVGRNIALLISGASAALMIGIPLCRILIEYFSWQMIYLVLVILMGGGLLAYTILLPESKTNTVKIDLNKEWKLLTTPKVWSIILASFIVFVGYGAFYTYLTPYLIELFPQIEPYTSGILVFVGACALIGNSISGYICDRIGFARALLYGTELQILVGFLIFITQNNMVVNILYVFLWMITGWFIGLQLNTGINVVSQKRSNFIVSLSGSIIQFSKAVGSSISAIVINQFGMSMIIFISMITSLLCVIFCLLQTIQKQAAIITSENI
ncbi:MFS transporter [Dubosiella newyorkensis]|uniref:MFS transporter n=1 Tax=Dubosiella newyorkensis TaxID=1862672 RepID=UPI0032B1A38D